MRRTGQGSVGDRIMKRGNINVRSLALWIYASVLFLAAGALGFHFLSIQTADGAPAAQAAAPPDLLQLLPPIGTYGRLW